MRRQRRIFPALLRDLEEKDPHAILLEVCREHDISAFAMLSDRRDNLACKARTRLIMRLAQETRLSHAKIGELVGRERSTISYVIAVERGFRPKRRNPRILVTSR